MSWRHLVEVPWTKVPVLSPLLLLAVLLVKPESEVLHPAMKSDLHGRPPGCRVLPWL